MTCVTIGLVEQTARREPILAAAILVYGCGLVSSYVSSAFYHSATGPRRARLRRYDRATIHLAIAGGQTPLALAVLPECLASGYLAAVWGLATLGVCKELADRRRARRCDLALYLLNAWGILLFHEPLAEVLSPAALSCFLSSGALYTVGAGIMCCRLIPRNHEIWHVCVLLGNTAHVLGVVNTLV
jgi:hemolysin III